MGVCHEGAVDADAVSEDGSFADEGVGDFAVADRGADGKDGPIADGRELVDLRVGADDDVVTEECGQSQLCHNAPSGGPGAYSDP
ncbi:hypothetical protein ACIGBL_34080 [Streptomyces sp. NPDC085614]|uniref:hypothetical protein n=1 Tax=Streptomyces sp. NPDC085614 TaxID=3365733 RepID=UPI0037D1170A